MKSSYLRPLLAVFLAFSFAACSPTTPGEGEPSPTESATSSGEKTSDPTEDPTEDPTDTDPGEIALDPPYPKENKGLAPAGYPSGPPNYPSAPGADLKIWAQSGVAPGLDSAIAAYQEATGASVSVDVEGPQNKILEVAASREYDVIIGFDWVIDTLMWDGVIQPMDYRDQVNRFYPAGLHAMRIDDQLYGVPLALNFPVLIRNTTLQPDAPATFADLLDGLPPDLKEPVLIDTVASYLYGLHSSMGVEFAPNNASLTEISEHGIDDTHAAEFIDWLVPLVEQGDLLFVPPENESGALLQLQIDETAAYITDLFTTARLFDIGWEERFEFSAIPAIGDRPAQHVVEALGAYISSGAKNVEAAHDFIFNYLTTDEMLLRLSAPAIPATFSANMKFSEESKNAWAVTALEHAVSDIASRKPGYPVSAWSDFVFEFTNNTDDAAAEWQALLDRSNQVLREK